MADGGLGERLCWIRQRLRRQLFLRANLVRPFESVVRPEMAAL